VATTVGPYWPAGLKLVDVCIAAGTHCLDLTGEILLVHESRRLQRRHVGVLEGPDRRGPPQRGPPARPFSTQMRWRRDASRSASAPLGSPATREARWIGPFVMASYNTRVVRRSAVLLDYGPQFRYRSISAYGIPVTALVTTSGLGTVTGGLAFPPIRRLLDRVLSGPRRGTEGKVPCQRPFQNGGLRRRRACNGSPPRPPHDGPRRKCRRI
jgi:short subunit dehydrogenase-like uncharacterized protein